MAQPFISHGTKTPSTHVLCMERSGLTHVLPQVQHDHKRPAELQHPSCLLLAQLLALSSSSEISVEVILWHACRWQLGFGDERSHQRFFQSELFLEHCLYPLLHTKGSSVACPGQGLLHEINYQLRSRGPATEICPHPPQLVPDSPQPEGLHSCNCIRSHITVNYPYCLQ